MPRRKIPFAAALWYRGPVASLRYECAYTFGSYGRSFKAVSRRVVTKIIWEASIMDFFLRASAAILFVIAGTSVCEAEINPLLGSWTLSGPGYVDRDGNDWCKTEPRMDFTATTQTIYTAATQFRPGAQSVTAVHYLVSGNKVYVASEATFAGAPSYTITGPGKMMSDDVGHCPYQRK